MKYIPFLTFLVLALGLTVPGSALAGSAIFLEVVEAGETQCGAPHSPASLQTSVGVDGGESYIVYLLAQADLKEPFKGLAGMQMAITYPEGNGIDEGIEITSWTLCGDLQFVQPGWPGAGYGNTITYRIKGAWNCRSADVVVGGFFEVQAHGHGFISIAPYGPTGLAMTANCHIEEDIVETPVDKGAQGWVAFNTAGSVPETGCNPLIADCSNAPTPVALKTWGAVKSLYAD
jgi:hypothetical protein